MAVISVRGLTRVYRTEGAVEVHALRGIDLDIEAGEFVAIMGPSGSGKSTMMNILGCLDQPTSGSYRLDGQEVADLSKDQRALIRNRRIGFVFQGFNLLARTSALENVELPLLYRGISDGGERHRMAVRALEHVGLGGRVDHVPTQLSGGEQQRVAIARALVGGPSLILADEPTGNLDTKTSDDVMDLFRALNQDEGMTLVMVTHEPDVAARCRRVVLFRDGRILGDGSPEEILGRGGLAQGVIR
jgi:putative ABC transport system ATP-binding protein